MIDECGDPYLGREIARRARAGLPIPIELSRAFRSRHISGSRHGGYPGFTPALGGTLDLFVGGTFTRSTEASYMTSANTLAWAPINTRRIEIRGDGLFPSQGGQGLLLEGARENLCLHSEAFANAVWTAALLTVSSNSVAAPDGDVDADTLEFTADATAQISQPFSAIPANAARAVCTVWLRAAAAQTVRLYLLQKDAATEGAAVECVLTTAWQRFELNQAVGTGVAAPVLIIRNHSDAAARDVYAWGAQIECSAATCQFPSSYIRTGAAAVIRASDVLSYAAGSYPAGFLTAGVAIIDLAPNMSDANIVANPATHIIFGNDTSTFFALGIDGVAVLKHVVAAVEITRACTWSRAQALTLTDRPSQGKITVLGATTGDGTTTGTASAFTAAAIQFGSISGSFSFHGRFGRYVVQA